MTYAAKYAFTYRFSYYYGEADRLASRQKR